MDIYAEEKPTYLYMGANNTLYYPSKPFYVNTFRGYFVLRNGLYADTDGIHNPADDSVSGARQIVLNFGDDFTSIHDAECLINNDNDVWYDLQGRRLSGKPTHSGIYVRSASGRLQGKNNKRKVFIK